MSTLKVPINNKYSNPSPDTIKDFYQCLWCSDINNVNQMLKNGFPPNSLLEFSQGGKNENAALYTIDGFLTEGTLEVIDALLDYGIDINYRDSTNTTLLMRFVEIVTPIDLSKIETVRGAMRCKKTFDKLMRKKPSLDTGKISADVENIFDYARLGGVLHWFSEHVDNMTEEYSLLFETYKLAVLFEKT